MTQDYQPVSIGGFRKLPSNQPVSPRQLQAALRKPGIACLDCNGPIQRRSPKGPAPKRCQRCSKAHKALRDRLRPRGLLADNKPRLPKDERPLCCRESESGITCPQHIEQRQFNRDAARTPRVDDLFAVLGPGHHVIR